MGVRQRLLVRGVVQGVGFRPFVYALAQQLQLAGWVRNAPAGVVIEIEGATEAVESFVRQLQEAPPPLARLDSLKRSGVELQGDETFQILHSVAGGQRDVWISPDMGTCTDCLRELRDPADRRYRYPFINCTHCGPRYTIIRDLPYDRARTTMAPFPLCDDCRREYEDPTNRRFHAEPVCCPVCGPQVWLVDATGARVACDDVIARAQQWLAQGKLLAIKGLGGFHLACAADNETAVAQLRARKERDAKPFAVMVRDLDTVRQLAEITPVEEGLLTGPERPIVLLQKKQGHGLAEGVAPRSATFGMMLPYTPLHELLLEGELSVLVMTSGNRRDEPIAHTNDDALTRLGPLVDGLLLHDRDIHIRTDDSVVRDIAGKQTFLRRSRGYAPFPVQLPVGDGGAPILAVGPTLNNTVCVTRGQQAFLSHYIGDLEHAAAYEAFEQAIEHLCDVLQIEPQRIVCDLHPDYPSTHYARQTGLPLVRVQHHEAHLAAALVETGAVERPFIGVSYDGLGWGADDRLWGGEFFAGLGLGPMHHVAQLQPVPQPGGDAAAKRPGRMAYVYLREAAGVERARALCAQLFAGQLDSELNVVEQLIARGVNCPLTSSMGRLFDAAGAVLGVCLENTHHAQAPMELEGVAARVPCDVGAYPVRVVLQNDGCWQVMSSELILALAEDRLRGTAMDVCAARFHESIARLTLDTARAIRDNGGSDCVVLSGGVLVNAALVQRLLPHLRAHGFDVIRHSEVPPGDGGVCLGQAALAAWRNQCA